MENGELTLLGLAEGGARLIPNISVGVSGTSPVTERFGFAAKGESR